MYEGLTGYREERGADRRILDVTRSDEAVHHPHSLRAEIDPASHSRRLRHRGRHKACSQGGTRRAINTVERSKVTAVTGRPAFTKSFIDTLTPSRDATCTTITLHAAPRIVAFPARVELAARASHSCVGPWGTTSAQRRTAGTLLMRVDRRAERPKSPPD